MSKLERHDPLSEWLRGSYFFFIGEVAVEEYASGTFALCHRDDRGREGLTVFEDAGAAIEIARYDDADRYRPLKTAPNLRHGWQLMLANVADVRQALDFFYPGRLAAYGAWKKENLASIPLRETLERQTGMYRTASKITDGQSDELVGGFCRSDGGCLRTIRWTRDQTGALPSSQLPASKFDPEFDQTGGGQRSLPLLCQEACNLLVAAARKVVKG